MQKSIERMDTLMKKLDFIRLSTTPGERQGADIIQQFMKELGVETRYESFEAPWYEIHTAKLEVLEPYYKEYTVTGYGFSGNAAKDGLTADFMYVENAEDVDLYNAKGKIVLVNSAAGYDVYPRLVKNGVAGFVAPSGAFNDDPALTDLEERMLRPKHIENGQVPGVSVRMADALDMVRRKASKARLTLAQTETTAQSGNIIAEIQGTERPDEVVVFTGHYDSVPFSRGMFDNASGSVILAELAWRFSQKPPKRTVRLVWCGSEERGLLGSKAYVAQHEGDLEKIRFCINIDMAGPLMGRDNAIVMAHEGLCSMVDYLSKEIGHPFAIRQDIYSSDAISFADKGIPGINFTRGGAGGAATCHNRNDIYEVLCPESLTKTTDFIELFCDRIIGAAYFPVPREIPDNIRDRVDGFLRKKGI